MLGGVYFYIYGYVYMCAVYIHIYIYIYIDVRRQRGVNVTEGWKWLRRGSNRDYSERDTSVTPCDPGCILGWRGSRGFRNKRTSKSDSANRIWRIEKRRSLYLSNSAHRYFQISVTPSYSPSWDAWHPCDGRPAGRTVGRAGSSTHSTEQPSVAINRNSSEPTLRDQVTGGSDGGFLDVWRQRGRHKTPTMGQMLRAVGPGTNEGQLHVSVGTFDLQERPGYREELLNLDSTSAHEFLRYGLSTAPSTCRHRRLSVRSSSCRQRMNGDEVKETEGRACRRNGLQ